MQVGAAPAAAAAPLLICCIISAHQQLPAAFFSWLKRSVKATRAAILSHEFITRGQETKGPQNFHMHNEDFSHRQSACPNSSARPPSFRSD